MLRWQVWMVMILLATLIFPGDLATGWPADEANPLRLSQIYGGGGNAGAEYTHDFIELFNAGDEPFELEGWSVQYAAATGSTWQKTDLAGTIAPGGYYLIQQTSGGGGTLPLPTPDAIGTIAMSATAGKVALVASTATLSGSCPAEASIVDFTGYGSTANCFEGSGPTPAPSNTTAALRDNGGCTDTDDNAADFDTGAPTPRNTASPPHNCAPPGPRVVGTSPADGEVGVALEGEISITFSEAVMTSEPWFALECPAGAPIPSAWEGTDETRTITPNEPLPAGNLCTVTLWQDSIVNQAGEPMAADYLFSFTTTACGLEPYARINAIQGSGLEAALPGFQTTEGVVTAVFQGSGSLGGFFMQSLPQDDDRDPATSEGIFVYAPSASISTGDHLRLSGTVSDFRSAPTSYGQMYDTTQFSNLVHLEVCDNGLSVMPTLLSLPDDADISGGTYLERFEGMLVSLPQTLTVQQNYFQGRFGQLTLGAGGRIFQRHNFNFTPDDPLLFSRMLILDDGRNQQNPSPIPYYPFDGALRAGDTLSGLTGIIDQGRINSARTDAPNFSASFPYVYYRLHPTAAPAFITENPRNEAPPIVGGRLIVASFNVLNFFTTLNQAPYPPGSPYDELNQPRGANNVLEYERQLSKLLASLGAIQADIYGLIEIEAWNAAAAPETLAQALNEHLASPGLYAALADGIPDPPERDYIQQALLYNTETVTPLGEAFFSLDPIFDRPPLAQRFVENASGEELIVVVNHFKSKGSCPVDPQDPNADQGDGQGCWNLKRVQQAQALLALIEMLLPLDEDMLVIGDLNAYGAEEPITVLIAGGLSNLAAAHIPQEERYSYVFDGAAGYLDHALSTARLARQVSGAAYWKINADEPSVIDYNLEFKPVDLYAPHAWRASDHDPLLVGVRLNRPPMADDLALSTGRNQPVLFILSGSDPDGDPLSFHVVDPPVHGVLSGAPPELTYTPASGFTGVDSFSFVANDGLADSAPAAVLIAVDNSAPVLNEPFPDLELRGGRYFSFTWEAGAFSDPDGDALIYSASLVGGGPLPGWLQFDGEARTLSGTPPLEVASLAITITASDGLAEAQATFVLLVKVARVYLPALQH